MILRLAFGAVPFNLLKLTLAANVSSPEFSSKSSSSLSRPGSLLGVCPFVSFFFLGLAVRPRWLQQSLPGLHTLQELGGLLDVLRVFTESMWGLSALELAQLDLQAETSFEVSVVGMVLREVSVFARSKLRISSVCQTVFRSAL